MRKSDKRGRRSKAEISPDDTQEMFTEPRVPAIDPADRTGGAITPPESDETQEYELAEGGLSPGEGEDGPEDYEDGRDEYEFPDDEIPDDEDYFEDDFPPDYTGDPDTEDALAVAADEVEPEAGSETYPESETESGPERSEEDRPAPGAGFDGLKAWLVEFRTRTRSLATGLAERAGTRGSALLTKLGELRLPRDEIDGQKVLAGAGIAVIALLVGTGGYLIGKGNGENVDTARLEGEAAGRQAGAVAGATRGYAAGYRKGRQTAFGKSYSASYRRNYRRAYENAGVEPPKAKSIEVPKP